MENCELERSLMTPMSGGRKEFFLRLKQVYFANYIALTCLAGVFAGVHTTLYKQTALDGSEKQ